MDLHSYYVNQAANGFSPVYAGQRFQKGNSWFGSAIKGPVLALFKKIMPYLGGKALDLGANLIGDIQDGKNFKASAKQRFGDTALGIADDALDRVKKKHQSGSGFRGAVTRTRRRKRRAIKGASRRASKRKAPKRKPAKRKRRASRKRKSSKLSDLLI